MSAHLILGGNQESRWVKVLKLLPKPLNDPDTTILSGPESIGIAQIRDLERVLSLKPYYQPPKIAIIQADLMTYEAQTAILKTLEEPPGETVFLLYAPNANLLLPTILSRCQTIQLPAESEISLSPSQREEELTKLDQLLSVSPAQRLLLADEWGINKNKEIAIRFCQIQLILWREKLISPISPLSPQSSLITLKLINKTLTYLSANANVKLSVDNLLLELGEGKG